MTEKKKLARDGVVELVEAARAKGERPNLRDTNLRFADLSGVDLRGADLRGANLRYVELQNANLRGADLRYANLWDADLWGADLRGANLWGADLRGADLWGTNLRGADLWGTNLRGAYLLGGLQITDLPSGQLTLIPTSDGWHLHVGCWDGTPDQLRALIAQDEGWPEAEGEVITSRRPYLEAALALCEIHMKDHADIINKLKEKWGEQQCLKPSQT